MANVGMKIAGMANVGMKIAGLAKVGMRIAGLAKAGLVFYAGVWCDRHPSGAKEVRPAP